MRIKTPTLMEETGSDGRSSTCVTPPGDVHSDACKAQTKREARPPPRPPTKSLFGTVNRSWPKIPRFRAAADTRAMSEPPCRRKRAEALAWAGKKERLLG
ncbi:hypothetical protein IMZ48_06680, partial [Candidatus Bathyarchaeota archaeon]|nr:hypothetical protein [Candidatus Bathyarchaeota archaeon]